MATLLPSPSSFCCVVAQQNKRRKKVTATLLLSPSSFCFSHCKKKKKEATTTLLPSPCSLRYATAQLHKRKRCAAAQRCLLRYAVLQRSSIRENATVQRNVAFFVTLCYSAAPQEHSKEEQTKQTNEKKSKDAYLGPAWVLLWLQPQLPCSNSSKLLFQTPVPTAPAPSSLPLDVFGALAME
jgi:hypothetical protein